MTQRPRNGYVHAHGVEIVDGDGKPLLLHGVGLGNWLLPEGYMWHFGHDMSSPRQIEASFEALVGPERAAEFWRRFRDEFISEADIELIAASGFDHVRLPINARGVIGADGTLIGEGVAAIDRVIDWCESHGLWVLLDLHGAPGGQTGTNIDDSEGGKPELFMDPRNRALTVRLWSALAERYRDRTSVLGYDLLNEPLPNEWQHVYAGELLDLYAELTEAIRAVDPHHLIMYEGVHWATNVDLFTEIADDNAVLQFHRYWCAPHVASIAPYLAARDRLGVPLYMGEGGENTPEWIYAATRLYERHGIGWNFWPWKKIDTDTSPLSIRRPRGWETVSDSSGAQGDADTAWAALQELLDALAPESCDKRPAVVNALFARAPLRLPAWSAEGPESIDLAMADAPASMWEHPAGEAYTAEERSMGVAVLAGDTLRFPLSARPASWRVEAPDPSAFATTWDDDAVATTALRAATIVALVVSDE